MKSKSIILAFLAISSVSWAQLPDSLWLREYSIGFSSDLYSLLRLGAGGEISIAGSVVSEEGEDSDFFLAQTDAYGELLWTETYGGSGDDTCYSHLRTLDGGFVLCGVTETAEGSRGWLVKTDENGLVEWESLYGDTSTTSAHAVIQTEDGGYAFLGEIDYMGWLVKTDSTGTEEMSVIYDVSGGLMISSGKDLKQTDDDGFILLFNCWGGPGGSHFSTVLKTSASGAIEWQNSYGYVSGQEILVNYYGYALLLRGNWWDYHSLSVKGLDENGNEEWDFFIQNAAAYGIINHSSYDYALTGTQWIGSSEKGFVLKLDYTGSLSWILYYDIDIPTCIVAKGPLAFIIAGNHFGETFLFEIGPATGIGDIESTTDIRRIASAPNPFSTSSVLSFSLPQEGQIRIAIYDLSGRLVETLIDGSMEAGEHSVVFDGSDLPDGVYLIRLTTETVTCTERCVLIR